MKTYNTVVTLLKQNSISFREITHAAEGRCDVVSKMRGNELSQAAKAMVLFAKKGKKDKAYYLVVIPGDKQIDMSLIKSLTGSSYIGMAPVDEAKKLTECEIGAVPPFSFNSELQLIVDPSMQQNEEIVFNAGLLTTSFFMKSTDYIKAANPTLLNIIKGNNSSSLEKKYDSSNQDAKKEISQKETKISAQAQTSNRTEEKESVTGPLNFSSNLNSNMFPSNKALHTFNTENKTEIKFYKIDKSIYAVVNGQRIESKDIWLNYNNSADTSENLAQCSLNFQNQILAIKRISEISLAFNGKIVITALSSWKDLEIPKSLSMVLL